MKFRIELIDAFNTVYASGDLEVPPESLHADRVQTEQFLHNMAGDYIQQVAVNPNLVPRVRVTLL